MTGKKQPGGSITVFLSLTLILIMALLGTMVEVTRGKVCRIHGRRVLKSAADSLMTEYSRPLFDEYRLFFIENGGEPFRQSIAEYAAGTLNPDALFPGSLDFYDSVLNDVQTGNERYAADDGGAALQEQITAYMKRSLAADAAEAFFGKTRTLDGLDESAAEIDKKVKEEKEAAEESQNLLELMRLIDGVDCLGGNVTGEEYFVKKFFHGKKLPERFGISEPAVWDAMKGNIVELQVYFGNMQKDVSVKQRFAKLVQEVGKKTREALAIAEGMGSRLKNGKAGSSIVSVLTSDLEILEQTEELLKQEVTDETVSKLKQLWKTYDTSGIVFDYTGVKEKGGAPNPLKTFSEAIAGGLAKLVLKEGMGQSKKSVKNPDRYSALHAGEKTSGKDEPDRLEAFVKDEEVNLEGAAKGISEIAVTDFMMCEYMKKYFSSVLQKTGTGEKRLDYEWEYILCGQESDRKNVESTISRLVFLRSIINITALLSSSEKRETAYAAALAVVGFTGMEPLVRLMQTLFLVLWGTVESMVDVAAILQNKKVPLIKTAADIVVKFPELYQISNSYIMGKVNKLPAASAHSFGYPEYMMLLLMGVGRDVRCYRMMDLMEWKIRDNVFPKFDFSICVDSFQVTGQFSFATKFFQLPLIQNVIDRKLYDFQQGITVKAGYTSEVPD